MRKAILFGAGYMGKGAWYKLRQYYDVIAYADNNRMLWGTRLNGLSIIEPEELKQQAELSTDIIICSDYYGEISRQLTDMGIQEFFIMDAGFLYRCNEKSWMVPVKPGESIYYRKQKKEQKTILFVQNAACIRTQKIAVVLKECGFSVFLLYTTAPPEMYNKEFIKIFDGIYTVFTMEQLIQFVDGSEFDIVHSSNEPDYLTNLLLCTNKRIIHDTHDMLSLRSSVSMDVLAAEYLANTGAHGLMYTSEKVKQIAMEKYGVKEDKIHVLENLMASAVSLKERRQKLSDRDGEIHCVYEGGISPERTSHRYFEDIWMKIVGEGIHVHYYSHQNREYCLELEKRSGYFHYEGNRNLTELIEEMTQYDCGLLIFNVTKANRTFLETGSANKMYEYLNAGLPIATGCLQTYIRFVEKYGVGMEIHMENPLYQQFKDAAAIPVSASFLDENHLTMKSCAEGLKAFYSLKEEGQV